MSIIRIPSLLHCQTIKDWMITLQKNPLLWTKHQPKPIEIAHQNEIIYFALQGIAPFFIYCILFEEKIYLVYGEEYLTVLYRFIIENVPVCHKTWPFPQSFPTKTGNGTFSDFSKEDQQLILSVRVISSGCRVQTYKEFETLCRFYHKTDLLISSPI